MRTRLALLAAFTLVLTLLPAVSANAAVVIVGITTTFTGGGDGTSWSDAANWDNGVPASSRDNTGEPNLVTMYHAVIPAPFDVVEDSTTTYILGSLTVDVGASLTKRGTGWINVLGSSELTSPGDEGSVSIGGSVTVNGTTLTTQNLTVDGTLTLGTRTTLAIRGVGVRTLAGTGTVIFDHVGANNGPQILFYDVAGGLLIPSTMTIRGGTGQISNGLGSASADQTITLNGSVIADRPGERVLIGFGPGTQAFINNGSVAADGGRILIMAENVSNQSTMTGVNGGILEILENVNVGPQSVVNDGTISVTNGTLILDGAWANNSSITTTNSSVILRGTFTTAGFESIGRNTSPVEIDGEMNNTADIYTVDQSNGLVILDTGTIIGGTIDGTGETLRAQTNTSSTLRDVTYRGTLDLTRSSNTVNGIRIENSITFDPATTNTVYLSGAEMRFVGSSEMSLGGVADIIFDPARTTSGNNTSGIASNLSGSNLIIQPGITITGSKGYIDPIAANSTITLRGAITSTETTSSSGIRLGFGDGVSTVINEGAVLADGSGKIVLFGEVVTNRGSMTATGSGRIEHTDTNSTTSRSDVTLTSEFGATISIGPGATYQLQDGATNSRPVRLVNRGTLTLDGEITTLGNSPPVTNEGLFNGTGVIRTTLDNDGTLAPGRSPGTLSIDNDLNLGPSSNLVLEVDGPLAGTDHDQILVGGTANLNGSLTIVIAPTYQPAITDTVTVVTATGVFGTFAATNSAVSSNNKIFAPDYLSDRVNLIAEERPNTAPVIDPFPLQNVDEQTQLVVPIVAIDDEGDAFALTLAGAPPGVAIVGSDVSWTPTESQGPGSYTFDVVATDTFAAEARQTITVNVTEVNRPPVLTPIADRNVMVGDTVNLTATASDPDSPPNGLMFSVQSGSGSIDGITGDYTSTADVAGSFPVTIRVTDNGIPVLFAEETFTIIVAGNQAPETQPDNYQVGEDGILMIAAPGVLGNDRDPEGDPMTAQLGDPPSNGTVVLLTTGEFRYTPNPDWNGTDTFTYTASDGSSSPPTLVTIDVLPVDDAPRIDPIFTQEISEGSQVIVTPIVTDPEGDPFTLLWSGVPSGAIVNGIFDWIPTEGQGPGSYPVTVTATQNTDGSLFSTETFTVDVFEVNQAPVLTPIVASVDENATLTVPRSMFLSDRDIPANTVTLALEDGIDPVPLGAVVNGLFAWTPGESDGGNTYVFGIRATDDGVPPMQSTSTVTITVVETNEAPVLSPIGPQSADTANTLTFTVTATDADLPADTLTFSVVSGPGSIGASDGVFTWTPGAAGSFDTTVRVSDGSGFVEEIFTITVARGNQAPQAVPDRYRVNEDTVLTVVGPGVLLNDRDAEGDPLTSQIQDLPGNGTLVLEADGAFRYTPDPNWNGTDVFTYIATDGSSSSLQTLVTIDVAAVNDDPVIAPIPVLNWTENTVNVRLVTVTDADQFEQITLNYDAPPPSGVILNGTDLSWTPSENQGPGTYTVYLVASDGNGGSDTATVTINVLEANVAPVLAPISSRQVSIGDDVSFTAVGTDVDLPANTLAYSLDGGPAGATIDAGTGVFSWFGAATGVHTFDVVVTDDGSPRMEDRRSVTISVVDPASLPNDVSVDLSVLSGDADGDGIVTVGDSLTLRATITENNLGAFDTTLTLQFVGNATLSGASPNICTLSTLGAVVSVITCTPGTVNGSIDIDMTITLDSAQIYDMSANVGSSNPDPDTANNVDSVQLEARIRLFITETIGVGDITNVVPPLNLATILEAFGVTDLVDVVPPLTLATILEAIGVTDSTDVVPPLSLATILENISLTDSQDVIYDSDGNGIPDTTATAVNPTTGEIVNAVVPGTAILVTGGGFVPGTSVFANLFSDPLFLGDTVADENGVVALVVTVPGETPPGEHRIVLSGEWKNGGPFEIIFPIEVLGVCTITGTNGNDILIGTRGNDVICGFGGNDIIVGRGGDDRIFGGAGRDIILGGRGDDALYGEDGNDILLGGRGNDYLDGGPGADLLIGGRGRDTLIQ